MKKKNLSMNQLEALLNQPIYQFNRPVREQIYEFEKSNQWLTEEVMNLFDTMTVENGGIPPTPNDYINLGAQMTKEFFFSKSEIGRIDGGGYYENGSWQSIYLTWSDRIERAVRARLGRMYESMMAEFSAVVAIREVFPELSILADSAIDYVMGVDVVLVNKPKGEVLYLHIVKNSSWADKNIAAKAKRKSFMVDKNGRRVEWKRQWSDAHLVVKYDTFSSSSTKKVNGHYIYRKEFFEKLILSSKGDNLKRGELHKFHEYLVKGNIRDGGIKDMIIEWKEVEE